MKRIKHIIETIQLKFFVMRIRSELKKDLAKAEKIVEE